MKRFFLLLIPSSIITLSPVFAGPFDCENEMPVNALFGNRVPLTESDAKKAGWTKMTDIVGATFHSPLLSLLGGKVVYPFFAPGVDAANLKNWLLSKLDGQSWTSSQIIDAGDIVDSLVGINHKYISKDGKHEAVYDPNTGKLVNQGRYMGTYNKDNPQEFSEKISHLWNSVGPHVQCVLNGDYMWDPTTQCFVVANDGREIDVDCDTGRAVKEQPVPPAYQTQTIDNRQMKQMAANQINSAYSQATAIADSEGFGSEYRSAVSPVVNWGLDTISSIPDQQTVVVPAQ